MIKTILVCTDGSAHGDVATRYGIHLAKGLEARLMGMHVLDSRMLEGPLMADISGWIGAQPYGAQLQQFRELMQQKGEAVLQAFAEQCQDEGLTSDHWICMGHPSRVILEEEGKAELLILGRKGEHADLVGDMVGSTADRVSRNSVNPCLVVGANYAPITRILAAYDGSGQASQGLHEAVELAETLQIPLHVITIAESVQESDAASIMADAARLAEAHGIHPECAIREGEPHEAIREYAERQDCDLIVVGAHGHRRIREMFLGSTTSQLISDSDLPVLLVR
jgi:nucleotide-binding universal stress UspA family protein